MVTRRRKGLAAVPGDRCPLTAALDAIGGKWSLIALYCLSSGTRRFNELRRLLPGISHKVLAATLRNLEREGLVCRKVYAEVPPRVEYSISTHGETTQPVMEAMRAWGHTHLDRAADGGQPLTPSSSARSRT
jgi:DNA-binding HxlR family transcriptional regulator